MSDVIIARDMRKSYGQVEAVRGLSFDVHMGECYGLLGPNGAGKTTTMALIRCTAPLDGGQLKVLGRDVRRHGRAIRARIGVVPQMDSLDEDLSVVDNLLIYAGYFGLPRAETKQRADELLAFMALEDKRTVRIDQLSGGMRRRLLIARGLINRPEMLILDEPTTGLDPQARHHIWGRLRRLKASGTTMVLCTHYMDEAEQLCDRLAIIDAGRILVEGTPVDLVERHAGAELVQISGLLNRPDTDLQELMQDLLPDGCKVERHDDSLTCFVPAGAAFPAAFVEAVHNRDFAVTTRRASLEDVFLNLTGRELRE